MNNIAILFTNKFLSDSKKLSKKYPSFKNDLKQLFDELKLNPNIGTKLTPNIYKIRLKIKSKSKGKSSGARVITYIHHKNTIYLVTVYDKSEIVNITQKEIKDIISKISFD